jgi:hypothetical protein
MTHETPLSGSPRDGASSSRTNVARVPLLLLAALWAGAAGMACAQDAEEESGFSYGAELEATSRYVWRGIELTDGAAAQPLVWASLGGFTLSGWGDMPLEGTNSGVFDEADVTLGYSAAWGKLKIEPALTGYYYYHQPDAPNSGEITLTFTYPVGPVELSLEHDQDVVEYSGAYFDTLAATWTGAKSGGGLTPAAQLAFGFGSAKFNEANIGPSVSGLNFVMADFGVTYESSGAFYARAHLCVLTTVDDAIADELPSGDLVFGGVVLGLAP